MNSPGPLGELCLSYSRFCAHQKCEGLPHESKKDEQGNIIPPPVHTLDFARPWKRWDMIETLEEKLGVKFPPGETLHTEEANKFLRELCTKVIHPLGVITHIHSFLSN